MRTHVKLLILTLLCLVCTVVLAQDDREKQSDEDVDAQSILRQITDKELAETAKAILSKGKKTAVLQEAAHAVSGKTIHL